MEKIYQRQFMEVQAQKTKFSFVDVSAMKKVFAMKRKVRAVAGGTSASKTISILVWLIDRSQSVKGELSTVVSESFPHLEGGAILDFKNIMQDRGYWVEDRWHGTKHQYTFETGSIIEFKSIDDYGKAHGPRRDNLFINECNNLDYKIVDQLITRTRNIVWLDWNPSEEFWFYTEMLPHAEEMDIDFITLTYLDNESLWQEEGQTTLKRIESHKNNKEWWTVYGEGKLGQKEENIYKGWLSVDEIPHEAKLIRRGLDFGYTNDPTALVAIYKYNNGFILDEEIYLKGLSNKDIADVIKNLPENHTLIKADCAEPKSIDELKLYGLNVLPAKKGQGSVNQGIQYVQFQRISYTKRSINLVKEYRNYRWLVDKNGKVINEPRDAFNHLMDAIRYALDEDSMPNEKLGEEKRIRMQRNQIKSREDSTE